MEVTGLEVSQVISPHSPQEGVLLNRDILDALIAVKGAGLRVLRRHCRR
jgi:hypothetical protein